MQIVFNFPKEYLIQVQGTFGSVATPSDVVTSLCFITNMKTYGPFGVESGQKFETSQGSRIVGFYGQASLFVDRIGVFTTKKWDHNLSHKEVHAQDGIFANSKKQVREIIAQGPWGGIGGSPFYDGRGDIVEILVEYTEDYIISLQAIYEQGGGVFKTTAHFGPGGNTAKVM